MGPVDSVVKIATWAFPVPDPPIFIFFWLECDDLVGNELLHHYATSGKTTPCNVFI